jgi:cold shock CspA family protein
MSSQIETARLIGQVKWFNNKSGYGFITVSDGENSGKDIFAHFSTIHVGDSQYKYLVQGEYVEFELTSSTNGAHEFQATNISGIKGGRLMCETRQSNRVVNPENKKVNHNDGFQTVQKKRNVPSKKNVSNLVHTLTNN